MKEGLLQASLDFLVRYGGDAFPNLFTSAKGTIVKDSDGREYLDFTSGQMCATIGHNHPAIVEAVHRAGEKAFHFFSGMIPEVVVELAETRSEEHTSELQSPDHLLSRLLLHNKNHNPSP